MREVAWHLPIGQILDAEPEEDNYFRLKSGRKVKRVHIWGNVVQKFESEDYVKLIIDDFTGVIPVLLFGDLADQGKSIEIGDRVDVVGRIRERNGRRIVAETIRVIGAKEELLRRLENIYTALGVKIEEEETPPPPKEEKEEEETEEMEVETLEL